MWNNGTRRQKVKDTVERMGDRGGRERERRETESQDVHSGELRSAVMKGRW